MTAEDAGGLAAAFGAEIDVRGPDPAQRAFFLVVRERDTDHETVLAALLRVIGGAGNLLLHADRGLFVVWATFGTANRIRAWPEIDLVGGISVDRERLLSLFPAST